MSKTKTTRLDDPNALPGPALPPPSEELSGLRAQHEQEGLALAGLIEQTQAAQRSLASVQKRLKGAELRRESEIDRAAAELRQGLLAAEGELAALRSERERATSELAGAAQNLRALAASLTGTGDPLAPPTGDDDPRPLEEARGRLASLAERKCENAAGLGESLAAARDLAEAISARIRIQTNRVAILRGQVAELEKDLAEREQSELALRQAQERLDGELRATREGLEQAKRTSLSLGEELEAANQRFTRHSTTSLEKEGKMLAERERIDQELAAARDRGETLANRSKELTGLLRKAERAGADLARVLVDVADADLSASQPVELPSLAPQRDTLAELGRDASNSMDDEVDGLFRQDIGEELVGAARGVADGLASRRRALAAAIEAVRSERDALDARLKAQGQELDGTRERLKTGEADLARTRAQLESALADLEARAKELAERQKEATGLRNELERLGAANADQAQRLERYREVQAALERTQTELAGLRKELTGAQARAAQLESAQQQLARQLMDLAGAADSSLAIAGLKADGTVSRLTRTVSRLEGEVGKGDGLALVKSSIEVVDKLTARLTQLAAELQRRGESLEALRRERDDLTDQAGSLAKSLAEREDQVRRLQAEAEEQGRLVKKGQAAEERLTRCTADLQAAQAELEKERGVLRQLRAELEELRARAEDAAAAAARDGAELRRRLADEQKARRQAEVAALDQREEQETALSTLRSRAEALERAVEERDERLATLQAEVDGAADARARLGEALARAEAAHKELKALQERHAALEQQLADSHGAEAAAEDLAAAHKERDAAQAKLRSAERRLADEAAQAASLKALNDSLRRKLDDRASQHRGELESLQQAKDTLAEENRRLKEKLAGLNAKVKTLTSL